jgi:catechol 2,3-dioxygenase-like lactoylglutathione lyase family enzyme
VRNIVDTSLPMGEARRLFAAVIFVRELARSEDFYRDLLGLETEMASPQAVLLSGPAGDRLVLRALARAPRTSGGIGVQYLIWAAQNAGDLERCENVLKTRGAFVSTTQDHGVSVVEGHDPDGIPVLLVYPPGPGVGMTALPARIYVY